MCTRSGTARLPRERARERRGLVPHELVQRSCLVRPVLRCGHLVGAGAADLRPGSARPDDRQPDRRPTERDAGRHLHRVQQREREEEAWRLHPRPPLDRQGHDLVGAVRRRPPRDDRELRPGDGGSSPNRRHPPEIAVDSSATPARGRLYAVWQDASPNRGQADAVAFSQSLDGGLTWSSAVKVNKTPTGIPIANQQAFTPSVDVGADGTVAVTYYDFRANTPDPPLLTDYFVVHCHPVSPTACLDPANWVDERRLTNVSFDEASAVRRRVLHRRLRGPGERRLRVHAVLLAAARRRSVERVLPTRRLS